MSTKDVRTKAPKQESFDIQAFLESVESPGESWSIEAERSSTRRVIPATASLHPEGGVKLRVLSRAGKEAIVAMLGRATSSARGPGGQPLRMATAVATSASALLVVEKQQMIRLLHEQHALSDRFLAYVLARNIRVEADLVDQLFNSSEKRLARTLLLLARYGKQDIPHGCCRRSRRKCSRRWSARPGRA